jgi:hypothetical protein
MPQHARVFPELLAWPVALLCSLLVFFSAGEGLDAMLAVGSHRATPRGQSSNGSPSVPINSQ